MKGNRLSKRRVVVALRKVFELIIKGGIRAIVFWLARWLLECIPRFLEHIAKLF